MNGYHWQNQCLVLDLHIQPKASHDEWVGHYGERIKLRIKAPPIDGKANAYLIKFMAQAFGVHQSACQLLSGQTGRNKRIRIESPQHFPAFFSQWREFQSIPDKIIKP